jgi:hypothetical protein
MKFGQCQVCKETEARYKCPKCDIVYCSLKCFKDERHAHEDFPKETAGTDTPVLETTDEASYDPKYHKLFQDERLQYLLKFKALQIHLYAMYKILTDSKLSHERKMDMANDKLNSLRIAGSQENELVEEFCEIVIDVLQES